MAAPFTGPGILWVASKITQPEHLPESTYLSWYDEQHIPEILSVTPLKSVFRFRASDPNAERPYLTYGPLDDLTGLSAFKNVVFKSEKLPDGEGKLGGSSHDCADLDYRFYQLLQVYEPNGTEGALGKTKSIITAGFTMGEAVSEEEFHNWYKEEHLGLLSKLPGYIRSTRYKLLVHRTNAETRAMKGLPSRSQDKETVKNEPPTFHAIHEFSLEPENLDNKKAMETISTDQAKRIFANATKTEFAIYRLEKSFGNGEFFH